MYFFLVGETDIETPSMGSNKARIDEPREEAENMAFHTVFLSRQTDIDPRTDYLNNAWVLRADRGGRTISSLSWVLS